MYQSEKWLPCVIPHLNNWYSKDVYEAQKYTCLLQTLQSFEAEIWTFPNLCMEKCFSSYWILFKRCNCIVFTEQWTMPIWTNNWFGYQLKSEKTHLLKEHLLFTFCQLTSTVCKHYTLKCFVCWVENCCWVQCFERHANRGFVSLVCLCRRKLKKSLQCSVLYCLHIVSD